MTITEQIARIAGTLPESLAREALDFVRFLQACERGGLADGFACGCVGQRRRRGLE